MSLADELAYTTVVELAGRIRRREVSPVEVLEATIERIEARNPSLNALVYLGFDDARAAARAAEAALMSGEAVGLLHGVPAAIKDLFDFKPGWPSTFGGIPALRDFQLDIYCAFAERAEQAGAILVGKGNSPVMGFRGVCDNPLFGPSRNPFDTSRNTGGSSGGCAAAVADGLLTFAEGTDGGGSIRIPASWCGIYGLKQSFGRVPFISRPNAFGGTDPFLFEGPLTRTVEDAALVLTAIAGYDPRDPLSFGDADRLHRRGAPPDQGHAHRLYARLRRVPDRPAHRGRGRRSGTGFRAGGRACRGGAARDQARPARAVGPLVPADHADQHRHNRRAEGHGDSTSPTSCPRSTANGSTAPTSSRRSISPTTRPCGPRSSTPSRTS